MEEEMAEAREKKKAMKHWAKVLVLEI